MKKSLLIAVISLIVVSVQAQQAALAESKAPQGVFSWEQGISHDFGKIAYNVPVSHQFDFINTGTAPLIISEAKGSCGCTVTEYSQDPVAPGERGVVTATYNAKKAGSFTKAVTVYANTGEPVVLQIRGEVAEK